MLIARGHISFIANFDKDIKDAQKLWDAELKKRKEMTEFIEEKGKGRRKVHRR
jgi:hypothetical protein